jgi:nucleoid-associated protein YgaU
LISKTVGKTYRNRRASVMGLFDKMFGEGATAAQRQPDSEQRFNELKGKYGAALNMLDQLGVRLQNLHVQDDRLYVKGLAPSDDAINKFWDQLKAINPSLEDITVDLTVDPSVAQAAAPAASQTYTVQSGDTLSKISKQFYGDANEYMKIFYANRDKLKDPDKIQIGQQLVIPLA